MTDLEGTVDGRNSRNAAVNGETAMTDSGEDRTDAMHDETAMTNSREDGTDAAEVAGAAENSTDAGADAGGGGGLEEQVKAALRTVTDPELGINIVDLGLVYDVEVEEGAAKVTMTLTSPGCPAGGQILGGAKDAAESVDGVEEAVVSLVWKPFWTPDRIDPKVRAMMGF